MSCQPFKVYFMPTSKKPHSLFAHIYAVHSIGFQTFFVQAAKIVVNS